MNDMHVPQILRGNSLLGHLLNTVITTAGVILVGFFAFKGNLQPAQLELLASRVSELEDRLDARSLEIVELNRELLTVRAENSIMRIQLDEGFAGSPRGTLFAYMDAIEAPAWCKRWEEPNLVMEHINNAYEGYYQRSKELYVGNTDFDVWPRELAEQYYKHDLDVYQMRSFRRFSEKVLTRYGEEVSIELWKFYFRLPDTTEMICGIQIGVPREPRT